MKLRFHGRRGIAGFVITGFVIVGFLTGFMMLAFFPLPTAQAQTQTTPPKTPSASTPASLSADEQALLARISAKLNAIGTLQCKFLQIGPDGSSSQGTFYLLRPQRMRFEFQKPNPLLVVADGTWLIIKDNKLGTYDRYPIGSTPISLLLRSKIDLSKDKNIRNVERIGNLVRVTARDKNQNLSGEIVLTFEEPDLTLRQWVVTDAQGGKTIVAFSDHAYGMVLKADLFKVEAPGPKGMRGRTN